MKKILCISIFICYAIILNGQTFTPANSINAKSPDGPHVNGLKGGEVKKEFLLTADILVIIHNGSDSIFVVAAFVLTIVEKDKPHVSIKNSSNGNITSEMKEAIRKTPEGSKIYFEYIKGDYKDGSRRSFASLNFILK